jgi:membrane protease YdiL (CAAX protease family)
LNRSRGASPARRLLLALEYAILFLLLPVALALRLVKLPVFPALWLLCAICLVLLLRSPDFDRRALWNAERLRQRLSRALLSFLLGAPLLVLLLWWVAPERWLGFVRGRPLLWAVVMVLYPLLSVYPQGVVYRVFIFHRYRTLFPGTAARVLASALAFSAVHLVFENWVAPVLTLVGGVVFGWTYARTRSSLVVGIQHAAFGCFIFTIGLGWYFYLGGVR